MIDPNNHSFNYFRTIKNSKSCQSINVPSVVTFQHLHIPVHVKTAVNVSGINYQGLLNP